MKTALITGISGQDGSLLAKFLVDKKYKVYGVIPDSRTSNMYRLRFLGIDESVVLLKANLQNFESVKNLLLSTQPDELYNLAAISSVGRSFEEPIDTFEFNTQSVLNLLECVRQFSPDTKLYHASSSEMFGNVGFSSLPIKESFHFHPVSPYGISKASAHWLAVNYRETYKMKVCCGILFNHESALRPKNFVIKKIISTAIRIKEGSKEKLSLGNTSIIRDWGYAPKYIEAMWLMMQQETFDDYLICSGIPVELKVLVSHVFSKLDLDESEFVVSDSGLLRRLELNSIYGRNTKAIDELRWDYAITPDMLIALLIRDEIAINTWLRLN